MRNSEVGVNGGGVEILIISFTSYSIRYSAHLNKGHGIFNIISMWFVYRSRICYEYSLR